MYRRSLSLVLVLGCWLTFSGCASEPAAGEAASPAPVKKVRTGFYVDKGSAGGAVLRLARLLVYSPELEVHFLTGEDLRGGALDKLDLFVVPGGSSEGQYLSMQDAGVEAVRRFVAAGGSYFGVCAGFHCALNKPRRIGLLPFTHMKGGYGLQAPLVIDLSEKGAQVLDIPKGRYTVSYSQGPVAIPSEQPGAGWGEKLAVYVNSVSSPTRPKLNFSGTPAIIRGEYGKGKVIATSFHPEVRPESYPIALGCVGAVTGVRPHPVFPVCTGRPIRVAFFSGGLDRKKARDFFELDKAEDIDVIVAAIAERDSLEHVDMMIFTDGPEKTVKDFLSKPINVPLIRYYLDNGGKLLMSDRFAGVAPKHPNVTFFPAQQPVAEAVRAAAGK